MSKTGRELMATNPVALEPTATATQAAKLMKEHDIGDVLVSEQGRLCEIVTDRDLAIRCVADGLNTSEPIGMICSVDVVTTAPDDEVERAVELMKEHAIRRIPVVEGDRLVGVVALGDFARERDPRSRSDRSARPPPINSDSPGGD